MTEVRGKYKAGRLPAVRAVGTRVTGDLRADLLHLISGYLVYGHSTRAVCSVLGEIIAELGGVVDGDTKGGGSDTSDETD